MASEKNGRSQVFYIIPVKSLQVSEYLRVILNSNPVYAEHGVKRDGLDSVGETEVP